MTLTPSALEPAPGLPKGSEKWAARVCGTTKRLSVPQMPEISLLEGLLQNLPAAYPCAFLLGPGSWWPGPGGRNQGSTGIFGGLWPYPQFTLPLCLGVSHPRLCVPLCEAEGLCFPVSEGRCGCAHPL